MQKTTTDAHRWTQIIPTLSVFIRVHLWFLL